MLTIAFAGTLRSWGDADASAVRTALYGVILASLSPRSSGAGPGIGWSCFFLVFL